MTGWSDVYGNFGTVNETYLSLNPTAFVATVKLRKEPADGIASRGYKTSAYIGTLDCSSADISSTGNLPLASKIVLSESQFASLQTSLLSDSYDYAGCVDYLVVKTSAGKEKYRVKKTYDDEGFCITRELVKQ